MRLFDKKWILFLTIVALPIAVISFTVPVSVEKSKSVQFCGSCHVMSPYVHDLKNPDSESLASKHYQNRWIPEKQCYICHTDYSFFGPVNTKWKGLRHVAAFYIKGEQQKIKLYEPFPNSSCLHCHQSAKSFEEGLTHGAVKDQLFSGELSCMECHENTHNSEGNN